MSTASTKLLSEFEGLTSRTEKGEQVINQLLPWNSGPLSDDVVAAAR
jgi:hypothetical protein